MFSVVSYCQCDIVKDVGKASRILSATYVISLLKKWPNSTRPLSDLSLLRAVQLEHWFYLLLGQKHCKKDLCVHSATLQ